jgi:hypothetical protein
LHFVVKIAKTAVAGILSLYVFALIREKLPVCRFSV